MTREEAARLRGGELVLFRDPDSPERGRLRRGRFYGPSVSADRVTLTAAETEDMLPELSLLWLYYTEVFLPPPPPVHDPQAANVYADWLDESGHREAAAALREAFPLADGRAPATPRPAPVPAGRTVS